LPPSLIERSFLETGGRTGKRDKSRWAGRTAGRLFAPEIALGRIHCNTWASPEVIIGRAF
jgi:hypothetical protein